MGSALTSLWYRWTTNRHRYVVATAKTEPGQSYKCQIFFSRAECSKRYNAPFQAITKPLMVDEGGECLLGSEHLQLSDADSVEEALRLELLVEPQHGALQLNSFPLKPGQTFTVQDLTSHRVRFDTLILSGSSVLVFTTCPPRQPVSREVQIIVWKKTKVKVEVLQYTGFFIIQSSWFLVSFDFCFVQFSRLYFFSRVSCFSLVFILTKSFSLV